MPMRSRFSLGAAIKFALLGSLTTFSLFGAMQTAYAAVPSLNTSHSVSFINNAISTSHQVSSLASFIVLNEAAGLVDFDASAAAEFDGASLVITRAGGVDSSDQFGYYGNNIQFSAGRILFADVLVGSGQLQIGTYQLQPGQLTIEFNSNATPAAVEQLLRSLRYRNVQQQGVGSVTLEWKLVGVKDGQQAPIVTQPAYSTINVVNEFSVNSAPQLRFSAADYVFGMQQRIVGLAENAEQGITLFAQRQSGTTALTANGEVDRALSQPLQAFDLDGYQFSQVKTLALSDGSVIALANYDSEIDDDWGRVYYPWIIKYHADGSLDPNWKIRNFAGGGATSSSYSVLIDGTLDSEGRLLVLKGDASIKTLGDRILRFNANGQRDSTFGASGAIGLQSLSGEAYAYASRILPIGSGCLVVGKNTAKTALKLLKLTDTGTLDSSFNGTGMYVSNNWNNAVIAVQGERVVLAKTTLNLITGHKLELQRLNADGSVDDQFNTSVALPTTLGNDVNVRQLHTLNDGKLLVLADIGPAGKTAAVILRLNEDGSLDQTFGSAGEFRYAPKPLADNMIEQVMEMSDGRLAIAGTNWLIRLTAAGILDTSFQPEPTDFSYNTLAQNLEYRRGDVPIALFAGLTLFDPELAALGSYAGLVINIDNLSSHCQLGVSGAVSIVGESLYIGEQAVASAVSSRNCQLKITFNDHATQASVNEVLQAITYANNGVTVPDVESVWWQIYDGNQGAQGAGERLLSGIAHIAIKRSAYRMEMQLSLLTATQRQAFSYQPTVNYSGDTSALTFSAENLPAWLTLNAATGELTGTPFFADIGTHRQAKLTVSDGVNRVQVNFSVEVLSNNHAPVISGVPASLQTVNAHYVFLPQVQDADGDTLTFSVENLPAWAAFDQATGRISGTPQAGDIGVYAGITITAHDQQSQTVLPPFTITVRQSNSAPVVSGQAATVAVVGSRYQFAPRVNDGDGDALHFSISNLPGWASFDSVTGLLQGTPTDDDVGSYSSIVIGVSDGQFTRTLPPFSINVVQQAITVNDFDLVGLQAKESFAVSLALGDISADHLTDIVVGVPKRNQLTAGKKQPLAGAVDVFSAGGDARNVLIGHKREYLGSAVQVVADYDDDGISDLLVGKPGVGKFGEVALYSGSDGALIRTVLKPQQRLQVDAQVSLKGRIGEVIAVADINADGVEDLILGMPQATVSSPVKLAKAGVVVAFDGLSDDVLYVLRGSQRGEAFGSAIAVDGESLYVGSPQFDTDAPKIADAGRVQVFHLANGVTRFSVSGTQKKQFFGGAVASLAADLDDDGAVDWLVSRPGANVGQLQRYSGEQFISQRSYDINVKRKMIALAAGKDIDGNGVNDAVVGLLQLNVESPTGGKINLLRKAGVAQLLLDGEL